MFKIKIEGVQYKLKTMKIFLAEMIMNLSSEPIKDWGDIQTCSKYFGIWQGFSTDLFCHKWYRAWYVVKKCWYTSCVTRCQTA